MTATFGFLSVRQHTEHGYFGGYLVVNHLARPLEFHCTLPVKPSRAQQVLYGPTIDDFVCGEQVAKALTNKAKLKPDLVVTDCPAALALSLVSSQLIALLASHDSLPSPEEHEFLRIPSRSAIKTQLISTDRVSLQTPGGTPLTQEKLHGFCEEISDGFDFGEPLQRVIDALVEAHPIAKAA